MVSATVLQERFLYNTCNHNSFFLKFNFYLEESFINILYTECAEYRIYSHISKVFSTIFKAQK